MKEKENIDTSNGFYIWFNAEEKEEYFATPLYLYGVNRKEKNKDKTKMELLLKKDISKIKKGEEKEIRKNPSYIQIHYVENIGMFLINFLNADFSNYITAYNTFFYAYGFELVKQFAPATYQKIGMINEDEFKEIVQNTYITGKIKFIEWQHTFRKCVDFIYNLNGNEEFKDEEDKLAKFTAYAIKDDELYSYSNEIEIIADNYINAHHKYRNYEINNLIKEVKNKNQELQLHHIYTSDDLTSICFEVLEQITKNENLQIKICANCGRYFIPSYRQSEIYCDLPNVDKSPTCREKGANEQYKKNLENNKTQALYRKIYRQKFMEAQRKKDSKKIQNDFEKWKKEAKDKINNMKKGKIKEDEVYNWLEKSK